MTWEGKRLQPVLAARHIGTRDLLIWRSAVCHQPWSLQRLDIRFPRLGLLLNADLARWVPVEQASVPGKGLIIYWNGLNDNIGMSLI